MDTVKERKKRTVFTEPWEESIKRLPEELQENCKQIIVGGKRKKISILSHLLLVGKYQTSLEKSLEKLQKLLVNSKSSQSLEDSLRDKTTQYLNKLSEEKLEEACNRYNVSYLSFRDDKGGMIEAIVDEMFPI